MEGGPGFHSGPPEAKRPGLGDEAPRGSRPRGHSAEGSFVSWGPEGSLPWCPLPLPAPLLRGLPLGEQKGGVGDSAPRRRRAPNDAEGSPSPKSLRGAPEIRPAMGPSSGLALSLWGPGGAPGSPRVLHMRSESPRLSSVGQIRALVAWNSPRGAPPQSVPEMAGALVPSSRALTLSPAQGAEGARELQPAVLGAQSAAPPRDPRFLGARIFGLFNVVLESQKDKSGWAGFGGCEPLRSRRVFPSLCSQNNEVRAGASEPQHTEPAARSGPARVSSGSEFLAEKENNAKRSRRFPRNFPVNDTSEKHSSALPLTVALASGRRDASFGQRRPLAVLPTGDPRGPRHVGRADVDTYFLKGIWVSTQHIFLTASSGTNCFLPIKSRFLERDDPFTVFEMDNLTGLSFAFLSCLNEIPKWKSRKLKTEKNSNFLKKENGIKSVVLKKRRRNPAQLVLTVFKTSNSAFSLKYELTKVRGNYVSKVTGTCHIITTESTHDDFKKYNSLHVIPKDTFSPVFDAYDKAPLLSDLGDSGSISLSERHYNNNKSSEKAISLQALGALAIRPIPQFVQYSQINTTEHLHKTNTNAQSIVVEQKQIFNFSNFNFKGKFNCFLDVEQQVKLVNYNTIYIGPEAMIKTQEEFVENSLNEGKGKTQDLIWSEREPPTENLTGIHNYQISNGNKAEREQKCSIIINNMMAYILNPNLLMKKKPNLEDARETGQILDNSNTTDRNEHQTILQESSLADSKLFHPNNESTEFLNHKFKSDLATRNNEHSPVLPAECVSTETRIISEFEMKKEFDIVLKELCMFHEIGKEEETSCIAETRSNEEKNDFNKDNSMEIKEDLTVVSEKICVPSLSCDTITRVPNVPKTVQSSFKWKKIHTDRVKEVPHEYCSSSPSDDELLSPSGKDFEKALSQNPALLSDTFVEGRIQSLSKGGSSLSHGIVRVYPLKTCRGPIRIGLSRKAKPKQLHPYLK